MTRIAIIAGLSALAACAAPIDSRPVSAPLSPAALPQPQVGTTLTYLFEDEREAEESIVAVDGQSASWQSSDGWHWTATTPLGGASATSWRVENGEGEQAYAPDPGVLFPLEVGKEAKASYRGVNNGEAFTGEQVCTVEEEARVEVPAGAFDTFVVVCERGRDLSRPSARRTFYYAPAIGAPVFQVTWERDRGTRTSRLVRYGKASS